MINSGPSCELKHSTLRAACTVCLAITACRVYDDGQLHAAGVQPQKPTAALGEPDVSHAVVVAAAHAVAGAAAPNAGAMPSAPRTIAAGTSNAAGTSIVPNAPLDMTMNGHNQPNKVPDSADPAVHADPGVAGAVDECPADTTKTQPGICGCGVAENCSGLISALVHRYRFQGTGTTLSDSRSGANGVSNVPLSGAGALELSDAPESHATLPAGLLGTLTASTVEFWLTWHGGEPRQPVFSFGTATPSEPNSACSTAEFFDRSWYEFCEKDGTTSWWKARGLCEGARGSLVAIESAAEEDYIVSNPAFTESVWMGANDIQTEGEWYFANANGLQGGTHFWSGDEHGSAPNGAYENWRRDQPTPANSDPDVDCAFIFNGNHAWTAYRCDYNGSFVCEWRGHQGSALNRGVSFTPADASGLPTVTLQLAEPKPSWVIRGKDALPSDIQIQIAVVLDPAGGSATLYIEGELAGSAATSGSLSELRDVDNWLGRSHVATDPGFSGSLSELRVYGRALTQQEIKTSLAAGPDPQFLE